MVELLILLLPLAAASGWLAARRSMAKAAEACASEQNPAYFQGLNYLLNEQPDKAIDVFVKLVEVDSETVETHLALGNLFRRRGEVDRAIRIHQNLIARPTLSRDQRAQALLELGLDYMRAGLFDRAESLFTELTEGNLYCEQSLHNLLLIYQQEKDWEKCLKVAQQLESQDGQGMRLERAHYNCELAEAALSGGDSEAALNFIKKAQGVDPDNVRAGLMAARLEVAQGNCKTAIRILQQIEKKDPEYLSEILPSLIECFQLLGQREELRGYLEQLLEKRNDIAPALALADIIQQEDGEPAATQFITHYLRSHPNLRGLKRLISLKLSNAQTPESETLNILRGLIEQLLRNCPAYQCRQCGFTAKKLHWNCPGCKTWSSMKPVHDLDGELR